MRIATFNVQNLRLRQRDGSRHFDGARDSDDPSEPVLPFDQSRRLDVLDRNLTARLIADSDADIVALQEVFDQSTLDAFHDEHLAPLGTCYAHRVCLEGNDGRSIDVAVLSRFPLQDVTSHAGLRFLDLPSSVPDGIDPAARVFRRDCLAFRCGELSVFVCHLKAAYSGDKRARQVRQAEAAALRLVIETYALSLSQSNWIALGDFNAHKKTDEDDLKPLFDLGIVDLGARIPAQEKWTYYHPEAQAYSCPDRIFLSHALANVMSTARPSILRQGISRCASAYVGDRYHEVGEVRPHASDHALMYVDLPKGKTN